MIAAALRRLQAGPASSASPASRRPGAAALSDLRGGLVTWLGSIYIVVLIPAILGMDATGAPIASIASTALACAAGTMVFAMVTGLPFAIGPGIVPASIVATFLAGGIPFKVVLGIEFNAGLLFVALAASGAIKALVRKTPPVLKTAGQIAIGLYLFLAALRASGILRAGPAASAPEFAPQGLVFLIGLAVAFLLSRSKRFSGYALLAGIAVATAAAALLGLSGLPPIVFKMPEPTLFMPDVAGAFELRYLDETLILLYVVIVDVIATLETIAACSPAMRGVGGRLRQAERGIFMSAVVFLASPFLGTVPMLVLFENIGGVMSGARTRRAAAVIALGFFAVMFAAPAANAIPAFACAVALGYVGYAITKYATLGLPIDPSSLTVAPLARQLVSVALISMIVTQSIAVTIFALFVAYPVSALMSGQRPKPGEVVSAVACLVLVAIGLG